MRLDVDCVTHALGVFDTLGDARAALDIAKGERARGTFVPPAQIRAEQRAARIKAETDALTLGEWAEQWLEALATNPECSPSTVMSYRSVLRTHVLPELGSTRLVDQRRSRWPPISRRCEPSRRSATRVPGPTVWHPTQLACCGPASTPR